MCCLVDGLCSSNRASGATETAFFVSLGASVLRGSRPPTVDLPHSLPKRRVELLKVARMQTLHVIPSRCHARVTIIALLLGGCGGASLTPENFRQQMAGSAEQLDVDRPLRDVGASFRERASACLNVTTKTYGGPAVRYTMQVWAYKASVVVTDARVELHVRAKYEGPTLYDQGSNGAYVFLAHATPVGARRTHLELWTYASKGDALRNAVKGWAGGSFSGCPDLS